MFEREVNYRIAKWILINMEKDGVICICQLKNGPKNQFKNGPLFI
jgi:hypothetical protein